MNNVNAEKLKSLNLFDSLAKDTINKLSDLGNMKYLEKGDHLFRDKDKVEHIYIIYTGKVSLYKLSESAHKKIVFILGSGSILNEVIIDDLPASINCEAFENTEIIYFPREKFINLMKEDFLLTTVIMNSLAKKIRRLYRQNKNSIPIKVEKKVAAKLWKLSKDYGTITDKGVVIELTLTINYLAEMFGIQRETISRALKTLINKGLIIKENKRIIVCDRDKLAKFFKEDRT